MVPAARAISATLATRMILSRPWVAAFVTTTTTPAAALRIEAVAVVVALDVTEAAVTGVLVEAVAPMVTAGSYILVAPGGWLPSL